MKFWNPDPALVQHAERLAHGCRLVLDVGAGDPHVFPVATTTAGWGCEHHVDFDNEPLPFDDREVDFLYCRHTLEDLANPAHLLSEIKRVAKAGWLECPSPIAEITRGVDYFGTHRGFCHHRWLCLGEHNELTLLAKYPLIEQLPLNDFPQLFHEQPLWSTVCTFSESHPLSFSILQNESGFRFGQPNERGFSQNYLHTVNEILSRYEPHDLNP